MDFKLMLRPFICRQCMKARPYSATAASVRTKPVAAVSSRRLHPSASFSSGLPSRTDAIHARTPPILASIDPIPPTAPPRTEEAPTNTPTESLPWYLQLETPVPLSPTHPFPERSLIPTLPINPPKILSPLLTYLSSSSGLESLSLLDLRSLSSPAPALGSNLLMILGTARSVKHLNVSADRLCRWLRKEYKLRPVADGLLGRNELKLKMRRKARRAKLAASVGREEKEKDDGITTGWICVNVGVVEGDQVGEVEDAAEEGEGSRDREREEDLLNSEDENTDGPQSAEYAGFGSRPTGPRVVVQLLTEEKREEMDLEGLWQHRAARRQNKAEKLELGEESADDIGLDDHLIANLSPIPEEPSDGLERLQIGQ